MKAPFGRVGGKKLLKKRIVAMFPSNYESMTYVEPFVGAGHVFYDKEPSQKEVINDKDTAIATIHRGLKAYSKELQGSFPVSRVSWNKWKNLKPRTDKEKFIKEYLLSKMSFRQNRKSINTGLIGTSVRLNDYTDRLKNVVIMNRDYENVVRKYDSPNTLFYFDPPYEESGRTAGYTHSEFNIEKMKQVLDRVKGKWILSYNDGKHIRDLFSGYNIKSVQTTYTQPRPRKVSELLISNF